MSPGHGFLIANFNQTHANLGEAKTQLRFDRTENNYPTNEEMAYYTVIKGGQTSVVSGGELT